MVLRTSLIGQRIATAVAAAILVAAAVVSLPARATEPITIGFGMALTGGLAAIGKSALLAMKVWEEQVNAKGGLLGRPRRCRNDCSNEQHRRCDYSGDALSDQASPERHLVLPVRFPAS